MKKTTRRYRIRNWHNYITALINRGSLTLWLDHQAINHWLNRQPAAGHGRPHIEAEIFVYRARYELAICFCDRFVTGLPDYQCNCLLLDALTVGCGFVKPVAYLRDTVISEGISPDSPVSGL